MFTEQVVIETDQSLRPPFLKGKGEMATETVVELALGQPAPGSPLPGAESVGGGVRSPVIQGRPVASTKVQLARELRQSTTAAAKTIWQAVRANLLNGL